MNEDVGEEIDGAPLQFHDGQKVLGQRGKEAGRQVSLTICESTSTSTNVGIIVIQFFKHFYPRFSWLLAEEQQSGL